MTTDDFKTLCRDEFGITMFSNPETYAPMKEVFGISGRAFVNWCYKSSPQPYFDAMVKLYFENKRLKAENLKLSESLANFNKRMENLTS